MGNSCPRRLELNIVITAEPESEPAPEAPVAGEGPAEAGDESDDGWEAIPIGAAPTGGPGRVVREVGGIWLVDEMAVAKLREG